MVHRRFTAGWTAVLVGAGVLVGGSCTAPTVPDGAAGAIEVLRSLSCGTGSMIGFTVMWPCSETIKVGYSGSFVSDLIAAIETWNNAIGLAGAGPMPTFEHKTYGSVDVPVIIPPGTGSVYCGDFSSNYRTINIYTDQSCDNFSHTGDLATVLIHELSHALGWTANAHSFGVSGLSDHCAVSLVNNQPLNNDICAHEIEGALSAYGLRDALPNDFWSYPFATGSWSLQGSVTVGAGSTVQLTPGAWRLELGGTVSGGYVFTSDNTGIATVDAGSGLVTGVSTGATTIRVRATSASGVFPTRKFQEVGETVSVTVTAPPPPTTSTAAGDRVHQVQGDRIGVSGRSGQLRSAVSGRSCGSEGDGRSAVARSLRGASSLCCCPGSGEPIHGRVAQPVRARHS